MGIANGVFFLLLHASLWWQGQPSPVVRGCPALGSELSRGSLSKVREFQGMAFPVRRAGLCPSTSSSGSALKRVPVRFHTTNRHAPQPHQPHTTTPSSVAPTPAGFDLWEGPRVRCGFSVTRPGNSLSDAASIFQQRVARHINLQFSLFPPHAFHPFPFPHHIPFFLQEDPFFILRRAFV